ncbi:MAG: glycerol-3-phosphate acyltransferase [Candidatus Heimdallarchaeota archaeon]|nr:glycerol-3-phosphate acyltransferase [Candidatus Heimdallarchaeota archaeon]
MYQYFLAPIIGYLFGSIPMAWFIIKLTTGVDPRQVGSGSVSTRNTVRTAGYFWAILTAALDVSKGFIAGFLIRFYIFQESTFNGIYYNGFLLVALSGLGAFTGHCWMPWMKFKGGKGLAVLSGGLILANPYGLIVWWLSLPIWLILWRLSSMGAISATASVGILTTIFYLTGVTYWNDWACMVFGWGCTILLVLRMIPDFKKIRTGEIKRWKGMKVSEWMK